MTISDLNLDDLSFQDIFESARKKIPVYSKLWTNHNVSDPGITFLELFSWIAETQIYSLNRIRTSSNLKILKLLGTQIRSATPSKLYVSLKTSSLNSLILDKGSILTSTDFPKLVFEVNENNKIIPISLNKILTFSSLTGYRDTRLDFDKNDSNVWDLKLFGEEVMKGNAFCIGLADNSILTKTVSSLDEHKVESKEETVKIFIKLHENETNVESYNALENNSVFGQNSENVVWEFAEGIKKDGNANWVTIPFEKIEDGTFGLVKSGIVTVKIPLNEGIAFRPFHVDSYHSEYSLNWLRCRAIKDNLDSPIIDEIDLNTITVIEGKTTEDFENLGRYEGFVNQEFILKNNPLEVLQILEAEENFKKNKILEEQKNRIWKKVDDFDSSESSDRHFVLNRDDGTIKFGDGINGKPPKIGNQIFAKYRYLNSDSRIIPKNIVFDNIFSSNLEKRMELEGHSKFILTKGEKGESIDEAFARVQTEFATPKVGTSKNDYAEIATAVPGCNIARAAATGNPKEGIVEVVIIPKSNKPNPVPTNDLLKTVQKHMNKHRMLTTQVFVKKPTYVEIIIDVLLQANAVTKNIVMTRLDSLLNPISGNGTPTKEMRQMGKSVFKSDIVSELEEITGVEYIKSLYIYAKSDKHENFAYEGSGIRISPTSFVFSSPNHNITIQGIKETCSTVRNKSKTGDDENEF